MKAYHFTQECSALKILSGRRLKVSLHADMNDPFEFSCHRQPKALRNRLKQQVAEIAGTYGVLCFSRDWHNPVMWSHYADKHRGLCLEFDVPEGLLKEVQYSNGRLPPPGPHLSEAEVGKLLITKAARWTYEGEWRRVVRLAEALKEQGVYFYRFDNTLRLTRVVTGHRYGGSLTELEQLAGKDLEIVRGRLAFETYRVVVHKGGWNLATGR